MQNRVILLVEDDARDEVLALRALEKSKIDNEVIVARDGEQALEYIFGTGPYAGRNPAELPQFVLLDLKLPKVDGLQVLRAIRADERTARLPVVIFTSSNEEEDLIRGYELGANSFVRKPLDPGQFITAAKQLGLYWTVLNQVARVLLIDAHEVVRDGLKRILDDQPGSKAFGEAANAHEALRQVREKEWDIVVLDFALGGRSGLDALKEIKQARPNLPVLVLSAYSEQQYARRAFKAGAAGYITKESPRAELVKAVNKVMNGGRYVSPALAERLAIDLSSDTERDPHESLSDREFEVMRLIASGKTVGEIAEMLSLSDKTISTYRARLLEKMGMRTNAELTRFAIENRLVD